MRPIKEKGYLIPAFNTNDVDYVACAEVLKRSILHWHPDADITILTKDMLPYADQGGQANDWQCFFASPYRQTVKLEADMYCAGPIDHWWKLFEHRDVVISKGCRNYYDEKSSVRDYRRLFDINFLPDVYNAITYWRMSQTAQQFFACVRSIFEEWDIVKSILKFPDEYPTTDVVYGIAAIIMGENRVCLPDNIGPTIVHMKKKIIGTQSEDWTRELVWEIESGLLKINTVAQFGLVHYHVKDWCQHG